MISKCLKLFILILSFISTNSLYSQVQISIDLERLKYIQHEPIDMTISVVNDTGSQLIFGKNGGKIEFLVLSELNNFSKRINSYKENFNPANGLILGAGETKKMTVRINKHFDLGRALRYRVKARISHPRLQNALETKDPLNFEVAEGQTIETRSFGLTDVTDPQKIITRKYTILGFHQNRNSIYCIKFHDSKWIYALHRLGPKVRGVPLRHDIDSFSNIHTLTQLEPKVFSHVIFSPDGKKQQELIYRASFDNVPRLHRDPEIGKISVRDGLKAIEGIDFIRQGETIKILNKN